MQGHFFAVAVAAMLVSGVASAEPTGVVFTGGTVSDGTSGHVGVIYAWPGNRLGSGFAVRSSVNAGTYHYEASGREIEGRYVGTEAALVYQLSGEWGWANFSAGPRISDTNLSPDDPRNERQGTRFDVGLQSDGAVSLDSRWRLDWLGSIGVRDHAYFGRVGLGRLIGSERGTRVGVEAGVHGDGNYTAPRAGIFTATRLSRKIEGQASVGVRDQKGRDAKPYGTVGLSILF